MRISRLFFMMWFCMLSSVLTSQLFEGTITYKIEPQNPNPEMISAPDFEEGLKEVFGERGYMVQKNYFKERSFLKEIEAGDEKGYQLYHQEDYLIYSWQEGASEAITLDSRKYMDEIISLTHDDETEEILGFTCKKITIKSKLGEMSVWYNKEHFMSDATFFVEHTYAHWGEIITATSALPLKIVTKGISGHFVQTAIDYSKEEIDDDIYELPEFTSVSANPMN